MLVHTSNGVPVVVLAVLATLNLASIILNVWLLRRASSSVEGASRTSTVFGPVRRAFSRLFSWLSRLGMKRPLRTSYTTPVNSVNTCRHLEVTDVTTLDWDPDRTDGELVARLCLTCGEQLPPTFKPARISESVFGGVIRYWSEEAQERRIADEELAEIRRIADEELAKIKARFLEAQHNSKPMILPPFWSYEARDNIDWGAESRAINKEVNRILESCKAENELELMQSLADKGRQPDGEECYCDELDNIQHWHGWAPGTEEDPPWRP